MCLSSYERGLPQAVVLIKEILLKLRILFVVNGNFLATTRKKCRTPYSRLSSRKHHSFSGVFKSNPSRRRRGVRRPLTKRSPHFASKASHCDCTFVCVSVFSSFCNACLLYSWFLRLGFLFLRRRSHVAFSCHSLSVVYPAELFCRFFYVFVLILVSVLHTYACFCHHLSLLLSVGRPLLFSPPTILCAIDICKSVLVTHSLRGIPLRFRCASDSPFQRYAFLHQQWQKTAFFRIFTAL